MTQFKATENRIFYNYFIYVFFVLSKVRHQGLEPLRSKSPMPNNKKKPVTKYFETGILTYQLALLY